MHKPLLHKKVLTAFAIENLSENDQLVFLSTHGDEIFATAIERFETLLGEPDQLKIRTMLIDDPEPETLINHLADEFDDFVDVLASVATEVIDSSD